MSRDVRVVLADVIEQCDLVLAFTVGLDEQGFIADQKTRHAVAYALLAIGEAVKQVPADVRVQAPDVAWRKIAGLRDVLAHGYFVVDAETIWGVIRHDIPALRVHIAELCARLPENPEPLSRSD